MVGRDVDGIWMVLFPLTVAARLEGRVTGLLPDAERARAERFVSREVGRRFAVGRAVTRLILAGGRCDAAALPLGVGAHGKPFCPDAAVPRFNLSHSGQEGAGWFGLLAIADGDVGVDLEVARTVGDVAGMARMVLSEVECGAVMGVCETRRSTLLLRYWTIKEAVLKAEGVGLGVDARRVCAGVLPGGRVRGLPVSGLGGGIWFVSELDVGIGWHAAVASLGQEAMSVQHVAGGEMEGWIEAGWCRLLA